MASAPPLHAPPQVIRPPSGWGDLGLRELWRYRELVGFLTLRTILVRYKQTALGAGWAVLQPLFMMIVFSLFFGRLAKIPSDGVPYPIFAFAGLLPWLFFANSLTQSSASLVASSSLLTKVYFPRLALPIAAVLAALVDLVIGLGVLVALMLYYGVYPSPLGLLALPALVLLACATAIGVGTLLAAINVTYRDVQYTVPFLIQVWLFATPVAYSASLVGEPWRTIFGLNPMAGVVTGFRWVLLDIDPGIGGMMALATAVALALALIGVFYFRRVERSFADIV